ncbi:Pantoate-beta-alanine ligase-domain-containing protein [Butyriboletus roseoflavus]|nr:Pantoate-beta-alanine ligase-domain-containing protein [Butyriboletus roseoflavus]
MSFSTLPQSPIPIFNSIPAYRAWRQTAFDHKKTVGLVPTMGALHNGHFSLIRRSLQENDLTVVSIFVNPAQFAPHEDLDAYPRTLPADLEQLIKQQVNVSGDVRTPSAVFLPGVQDMYPSGISQDVALQKGTFVEVKGYGHQMEVFPFFRSCRWTLTRQYKPTNAYFGQKDIQQALLLRRMCRDLLLANPEADHVHIVPTERDPVDGLALSSRNSYLSTEERSVANTLYRALQAAESGWLAGETMDVCIHAAEVLVNGAVRGAASRGVDMKLDYLQMNDSDTFEVLDDQSQRQSEGGSVILSGAVWVGRTRLIDNIVVGLSKPSLFNATAEDTWCIDPRGILTLSISKILYEKLGLVGTKLPFKGCPVRYVIHVPLKRETTSVAVQARQKTAVGVWDGVRAAEGLGRWHVAPVSLSLLNGTPLVGMAGPLTSTNEPEGYTTKDVTVHVRHQPDVGPIGSASKHSLNGSAWLVWVRRGGYIRIIVLWKFIDIFGRRRNRLHANDRVDPYVAVYDAPSPASIDDVTHLRWKGLMDSTFVQSMIYRSVLSTSTSSGDEHPFVSVTLHSNLTTPVSYISESPTKEAPLRVPGPEAEDTICLILSKTPSKSTWAIGQSIGKWDARWG